MKYQLDVVRSLEDVRAVLVGPYTYESLDVCLLELSQIGTLVVDEIERTFAMLGSESEQAAA